MIRHVSMAVLVLCWIALAAGSGRAATFLQNNGQALTGDPISANKDGLVVRISEGVFSQRVGWTNFTQEALQQMVKDAKIKPFAEPFIEKEEEDPEDKQRKVIEIKLPNFDKLDRPDPKAGFGALFSSPITWVLLLAMYAANLYAGFEVGLFRNYSSWLVSGIAAVAPVIGPAVFLCLPTHLKTQYVEEDAGEEEAVALDESAVADVAAADAAAAPAAAAQKEAKAPVAEIYRRGEFTFNRRFFETKLANFLRMVPSDADKDKAIQIKSLRGEFSGSRLSRIMPNEIYLVVEKGGASQDVLIPYTEIQQVEIRHKDTPAHA